MPDAKTDKKCAHPSCKCVVPKGGKHGRFCSEHCRQKGQQIELRCYCEHPECR